MVEKRLFLLEISANIGINKVLLRFHFNIHERIKNNQFSTDFCLR